MLHALLLSVISVRYLRVKKLVAHPHNQTLQHCPHLFLFRHPPPQKGRTIISEENKKKLFKAMSENPLPTPAQYDALVVELWPLSRAAIIKWFQNHRND